MTALAAILLAQIPVPLADLPFEHEPGRIWLKATLNGLSVDAILDTGADETFADAATVVAVGGKKGKPFPMEGAGGDRAVGAWEAEKIVAALVGTKVPIPIAGVFPMSLAKSPAGHRSRLMLGSDFLRNYVVWIDYAACRVRLYDPATFRIAEGFQKPMLILSNGVPVFFGKLELPGIKPQDVSMTLDTGSPFGLLVTNRKVAADGLAKRYADRPLIGGKDAGLGGALSLRMLSGVKGQIGDIPLNGFAFLSLTEGGGFGRDADTDVVVGDELLRHFDVVLDLGRYAMYFKPNGK